MLSFSTENKLTTIKFAPARAPKITKPEPAISRTDVVELIEQYIANLRTSDSFSGSIFVAQNDRVLANSAMGFASRRFDVPNNVDTKFHSGSMDKMFTGIAIGYFKRPIRLL